MSNILRRPLMLIIRDGWGHNPDPKWNHANAIHLAKTPNDDRFRAAFAHGLIHTSGEEVGLPAGVMGNSEVGHQNIGAGRIVHQEVMRITRAVRDGLFFENAKLCEAVEHCKRTGGSLHLMGLCSDAAVHSTLDHAYALMELAKRRSLPGDRVLFHAFGDGRDTSPESGVGFIRQVETKIGEIGVGRVATVVGRFYAMDRDNRWNRVETAYRMLAFGEGRRVDTATAAFEDYYADPTGSNMKGDEFIVPTIVGEPRPIQAGDAIVLFNFRGDRPREITRAFTYDTFPFEVAGEDNQKKTLGFDRGPKIENLYYCTLTEYEKGLPVQVAFPRPPKMENIYGAYAESLGLKTFRCAETEKYPHVTFFFNDYHDEPFGGEDWQLIASPRDVETYDQKPEMSARPVTEAVLKRIASDKYDVIIVNYANGDMVGHTGNIQAAITAIETVDECVGKLVDAVMAKGGSAIVTADHGNCEQMINPETNGPHTAHTTYDVPLIVIDDQFKGAKLREGGALAGVMPTLLALGGIEQPMEMAGSPLLDMHIAPTGSAS